MINAYRDELNLSLTKYSDEWKSTHLEGLPEYTKQMQAFDRWCRRLYELYSNMEVNEAIRAFNKGERFQREELNEIFARKLPEMLGDEFAGEKVFAEGPPHFTNEGFDERWPDQDLIKNGLPAIELMREWIHMHAAVANRNERDKKRDELAAEIFLDSIKHYDKERIKTLLEVRDEDIKEAERIEKEYATELPV